MSLPLALIICCLAEVHGASPPLESADSPNQVDAYAKNACVACHENLPGKLSSVVHEWKQSVHHANQVSCDGCHGGDPAILREQCKSEDDFKQRSHLRRDSEFFNLLQSGGYFTSSVRGRSVSYFCGKCHAVIKEKHLGSPHGGMGNPTCLYCHGRGSHAIQPATLALIDARPKNDGGQCATCHRAATMETVAIIKKALSEAEQSLETTTEQYTWLEAHGYTNLALGEMTSHSREARSRLRQSFHSFNQHDINSFVSALKDNADLTQQTYDMIVALEQAKSRQAVVGGSATLSLLAFAGLLLYYRTK
jgi:hypothetical protein